MKRKLLLLRYLVAEGRRYLWLSAINCARRFRGIAPLHEERYVFFQQYILHWTRIRRIRGITSSATEYAGAGRHALLIMNALNFARTSGIPYLHTPFAKMNHADRPMQEWTLAWEKLFNLGAGEALCDPRRNDVVNFGSVHPLIRLCLGKDCPEEQLARNFKAMIPEFRAKYYANKLPRTASLVTVAVHVRRGDVSAESASHLYTKIEVVAQTIRQVKSSLDSRGLQYSIRVYSQGNCADFVDLHALGVQFFLDSEPIWTMQELIEADVLIMAKGGFSCYAGIISDGIKLFDPGAISFLVVGYLPSYDWRILSQEDDWIPCQSDGSIDRTAFDRQLTLLLLEKRDARTTGSSRTSQ
jgi:hypothetical protein